MNFSASTSRTVVLIFHLNQTWYDCVIVVNIVLNLQRGEGARGAIRGEEHPHEPTITLHNIGNHKVESKSNVIGRGRSHCYALLSFPSPFETLEWRISSSEFTIGTALLSDYPVLYSFKYNIIFAWTPRIRWPRIRLVCRLLVVDMLPVADPHT